MKIQHSTGPASCKVNFNAGDHMQNTPLTPKKVVKLTAKPELSDTYRICNVAIAEYPAQVSVSLKNEKYYNGHYQAHYCYLMYVGDCGTKNKYVSTEIFLRAGVASIPMAALLKTHLGVEVDPQDGKSLRVCVK